MQQWEPGETFLFSRLGCGLLAARAYPSWFCGDLVPVCSYDAWSLPDPAISWLSKLSWGNASAVQKLLAFYLSSLLNCSRALVKGRGRNVCLEAGRLLHVLKTGILRKLNAPF